MRKECLLTLHFTLLTTEEITPLLRNTSIWAQISMHLRRGYLAAGQYLLWPVASEISQALPSFCSVAQTPKLSSKMRTTERNGRLSASFMRMCLSISKPAVTLPIPNEWNPRLQTHTIDGCWRNKSFEPKLTRPCASTGRKPSRRGRGLQVGMEGAPQRSRKLAQHLSASSV